MTEIMMLQKRFKFEAAHRLPDHPGKCKNLHGHQWFVDVGIQGPVDVHTGMIIDFGDLKKLMDEALKFYDHQDLNARLDNPTAENIVVMLKAEIKGLLKKDYPHLTLAQLSVWENPESGITAMTIPD